MITSVYVLVATITALLIGFAFLHITGIGAIVHACITGVLCALAHDLFHNAGFGAYHFWCETGILAASALGACLWLRCKWGTVIHIFLIAQSACCVFFIPTYVSETLGLVAIGIGFFTVTVFALLAVLLRKSFPERDWQETFRADASVDRKEPRLQQMYFIPAMACVLLIGICLLLRIESYIGCALLCLLGAAIFWLSVWLMVVINDYEKERTSLLAEQQYRGEMQSFLNVIRSQRHDFNFHVQTIAGLIRQNKIEDCRRYINALEEDVAIMNAVLPVKDPAISALIHNFRLMAVRQGTELHVDIHYDLSQIATNVYETNKIISNLLQNAIDEVSTHEDKSHGIWLTILKRGEYCVIRVSNKLKAALSREDLNNIYRQGYTTKQGHEGVGLSSLRTLIGRYKGVIYTQVEGDEIQFIARVPINYAKEPITE